MESLSISCIRPVAWHRHHHGHLGVGFGSMQSSSRTAHTLNLSHVQESSHTCHHSANWLCIPTRHATWLSHTVCNLAAAIAHRRPGQSIVAVQPQDQQHLALNENAEARPSQQPCLQYKGDHSTIDANYYMTRCWKCLLMHKTRLPKPQGKLPIPGYKRTPASSALTQISRRAQCPIYRRGPRQGAWHLLAKKAPSV